MGIIFSTNCISPPRPNTSLVQDGKLISINEKGGYVNSNRNGEVILVDPSIYHSDTDNSNNNNASLKNNNNKSNIVNINPSEVLCIMCKVNIVKKKRFCCPKCNSYGCKECYEKWFKENGYKCPFCSINLSFNNLKMEE